ncbi:MAG: hypothetical protein D6816_12375 [Bacteroidetes bacterium]|nr:MAG: hypothetical protein D6816_12375 [Bacteroidota bacterium]
MLKNFFGGKVAILVTMAFSLPRLIATNFYESMKIQGTYGTRSTAQNWWWWLSSEPRFRE